MTRRNSNNLPTLPDEPLRESRELSVAGHELSWSVRAWPRWITGRASVQMTVEIVPKAGSRQRLVIEFPAIGVHAHHGRAHRVRPHVTSQQIEQLACLALACGWSPDAGGMPFVLALAASEVVLNPTLEMPFP